MPKNELAIFSVILTSIRERLERSPHLRAMLSNTTWLMLDKLVRMVLGITVGAWVARYLGPADYGELAYVLSFVALFQAIASLGADGIVVRDIARDQKNSASILGTALCLRFGVGVGSWASAVAIMFLVRPADSQAIWMTAIVGGCLVFQAADTVDLWFQSQSQSRRTVAAKLTAYLISSGAKVVLILNEAPLIAFAVVMCLDFASAAVGLWVAYRSYPTAERWIFRPAIARSLISQSWPFLLGGVSVVAYMRVDQIMIREILGESDLGIYSAALPLSQVWHVIPMTLATSLAPYMARKKMQGDAAYEAALMSVFRLFAAMAVGVTVITAFISPWLVGFLYGNAFHQSSLVLSIHVVSNIFIFLGVAQGLWMINEGAGKIGLYKTLAGGVVSVVGNLLLIPRFGAAGAAAVAIVAQFVSAVGSNILFAPKILAMQMRALFFLPIKSK